MSKSLYKSKLLKFLLMNIYTDQSTKDRDPSNKKWGGVLL